MSLSGRFLLPVLLVVSFSVHGFSKTLSLSFHNGTRGIPAVECQLQLPDGTVLVGMDDGLLFYNGVQFRSIGEAFGLSESSPINNIVLTNDNHLVVLKRNAAYVSYYDGNINDLKFHRIDVDGISSLYLLFPWDHGFLTMLSNVPALISWGKDPVAAAKVDVVPLLTEKAGRISTFAAVQGDIWVATQQHRLCRRRTADTLDCLPPPPAEMNEACSRIAIGRNGRVYARSPHFFAESDAPAQSVFYEKIPFGEDRLADNAAYLVLVPTADGRVLTQWDHGIMARRQGRWVRYYQPNPMLSDDIVSSILPARDGSLWLGFLSSGEAQVLGEDFMENWSTQDGLSNPTVWTFYRQPSGPLWIGTDNSLDFLENQSERIIRQSAGYTRYILQDPSGNLWSGGSDRFVRLRKKAGRGAESQIPLADIYTAEPSPDGSIWLVSWSSILTYDPHENSPKIVENFDNELNLVPKRDPTQDALWFFKKDMLVCLHPDGKEDRIGRIALSSDAIILDMFMNDERSLWAVSEDALYHVVHDRTGIEKTVMLPVSYFDTRHLQAVWVDRRHWVWLGSSQGLRVYDGHRWVSVTDRDGLSSNDISQRGIYEDTDGTMWIATSRGLSHIVDMTKVFDRAPGRPSIRRVSSDGQTVSPHMPSYRNTGMDIDLGTSDLRNGPTNVFLYKFDGVDAQWRLTTSDRVHYAYFPPGRHVFHVKARSLATGQTSPETSVEIVMPPPWWQSGVAILTYCGIGGLAGYAFYMLRTRGLLRRQKLLSDLVAKQTEILRKQTEDLHYQATHDTLTGLLNRRSLQERVAEMRRCKVPGQELFVALFDVDFFKRINDVHGHHVGDEVLMELGRRFRDGTVPDDCAGRYGGEEFILLYTAMPPEGLNYAARIRESLTDPLFALSCGERRVTLSAGVTWLAADEEWSEAIRRADAALYEAKAQGRDRIVRVDAPAMRS
ncbi:MAG: diguanylate cyclase [Gluconacetobacter sp.]